MERSTYKITVYGTVQGVGFRPFVYTLADSFGLKGSVCNTGEGVEILLDASKEDIKRFLKALQSKHPPLASIDGVDIEQVAPQVFDDFRIIQTRTDANKSVRIPPDISICKACEKELFDPTNRRYRYPFITCTHCGVRYSIIEKLPYDRQNTSMRFFAMCKKCEAEYNNPLDRRYHAQPIGCFECGPSLELIIDGVRLQKSSDEIINNALKLLLEGKIIALKGVGGYHLMCDATNEAAVMRLRERKKRPTKPFAVMVRDLAMARELAYISKKEEELLASKERPVVIVKMKKKLEGIAPNISYIGLFLPYTPLHLLLLDAIKRPVVATSANISNEPICTNKEELEKLQGVYDAIIDHNREIVNGSDDSVAMVVQEQTVMLRRARGYAPASIKLPFKVEKKTLAVGANQKNTIAIAFENQAILSPHIGDLSTIDSLAYYKKNIDTLKRIYDFTPQLIAHDKHPAYESTQFANELKMQNSKLITKAVQHHYAHILGVMAEKKIQGKVFGVAFDGTGYGDDGKLWGGEFMVCDYSGYERVAHLRYFKLLGGEKAIKEPRRVALALLFDRYKESALNLQTPTTALFTQTELRTHYLAWQKNLNAPQSSSMGRLFDAVASLLGVSQVMSFEGESGMLLEELYDLSIKEYYPFGFDGKTIDILPMIEALVQEQDKTVAVSKFFNTVVEMVATIYTDYSDLPLVFSGGVFQNRVLLELLLTRFPKALIPNSIPPNDGGIALGQISSTPYFFIS